jgi:hypothetical protein
VGQSQGWQTDPSAIVGAFAGLVLGLLLGKLLGGRLSRNKTFAPRLTAITGRSEPDAG